MIPGLEFLNNPTALTILWVIAMGWSFFWKGIALWKSAFQKQRSGLSRCYLLIHWDFWK